MTISSTNRRRWRYSPIIFIRTSSPV